MLFSFLQKIDDGGRVTISRNLSSGTSQCFISKPGFSSVTTAVKRQGWTVRSIGYPVHEQSLVQPQDSINKVGVWGEQGHDVLLVLNYREYPLMTKEREGQSKITGCCDRE